MLSFMRAAHVMALRRTVSVWRLEMVLFAGVVLAVALLSSGVIFSDLLAEAALQHALDRAAPEETNFWVRSFEGGVAAPTAAGRAAAYQAGLDFTERNVAAPFKPYLRDQARLLETATFFYQGKPQLELAGNVRPRGGFKYMSGLLPARIQLAQGRWPYAAGAGGQPSLGAPLEVAVDTLGADLLQLGVGYEMEVFPAASFTDPPPMNVKIVGVFQRMDPVDEFWYGTQRTFSHHNDQWATVPLFTTEEAIFQQVIARYPTLYTDLTQFYYLDRRSIRAGEVDGLQELARSAKIDVRSNLKNSSVSMKLDSVLTAYEEQLLLSRIPLFLILSLIIAILAYYLALVASLIVRSRSAEIAMLKSRGTSAAHLGVLAVVEGLLLAVPAVALGPLVALVVVRALDRFVLGLGGGGELSPAQVSISIQAYLMGVAGGVLAVAVITSATLAAARRGIVEFQQFSTRPPGVPFFHRYFLDFMLLALIGLLWWQIQSRGAFLVRPLGNEGLEIDYSLLLGPVLGLAAMGLLVLRVFPIGMTLAAKVTEPVGPSWLVHGLRHVARDPWGPGVLVVFVMLATSLGVIGSTFSATLERSQRDRALYATGAGLRLEHIGLPRPVPLLGLSDLVSAETSMKASSEVRRDRGSLLTRGFSTTGVTVLAVDTDSFAQVAWSRADFAGGTSLRDLVTRIKPGPSTPSPQGDGIKLPDTASSLALWVQPGRPGLPLRLRARIQDAHGMYFDMLMGDLGFRGWRRLEAEIAPIPPPGPRSLSGPQLPIPTPPFTLLSLHLLGAFGFTDPGALFLGKLAAITSSGEELVADFQTTEGWHALDDYARPGLYALESSASVALEGSERSAVFSWASGGVGLRGVRAGLPEVPMPGIVSNTLLKEADARVGDTLAVGLSSFSLPLNIVAAADYFPTLYSREQPFVVVDLKTFNHYSNLHSPAPVGGSDELWVGLESPSADAEAITGALYDEGLRVRKVFLAAEMVSQNLEQPLVSAGWGGLLVLMFLALALASASGVMLFFYVDTRGRQTEFAVLRTLGASPKQLNGVVWFTLFLVAACGIGLGTWAGQLVASSLIPMMEVAEQGVRVTPPMVLQTNWVTLAVTYLVLAVVTASTVAWLAWLARRMDVQQVLRIGEDGR